MKCRKSIYSQYLSILFEEQEVAIEENRTVPVKSGSIIFSIHCECLFREFFQQKPVVIKLRIPKHSLISIVFVLLLVVKLKECVTRKRFRSNKVLNGFIRYFGNFLKTIIGRESEVRNGSNKVCSSKKIELKKITLSICLVSFSCLHD